MQLDGERVVQFAEKSAAGEGWINGGFFWLSSKIGDLIAGDNTVWEHEPIDALVRLGELRAYYHRGFWHPMDTLRERNYLNEEWTRGTAPWRVW